MSATPVPILRHINPVVQNLPTDFFKIRFNVIFRTTSGSSKWSLALRSPHQNPVCASPSPTCVTCPAKLTSSYDHHNNIWCEVQITKILIMQFPLSSSLLGPNRFTFLSTLRSILKDPRPMLRAWIFNFLYWTFVGRVT